MSHKLALVLFSAFITIIAVILLVQISWKILLGVFLLTWAENISKIIRQ